MFLIQVRTKQFNRCFKKSYNEKKNLRSDEKL